MKKALLLFAVLLGGLTATADDGIVSVGANITVLPSSYYSPDNLWTAHTWVYNTHNTFGDGETESVNYNVVWGEPAADANGLMWYEPGFDESWKEDDINYDTYDSIRWEEHTSPFSSDAVSNGHQSYQWSTVNIMADIYIRRTFSTDKLLSGDVYLACGHDDAPAEFYINGELVYSVSDGWNNSEVVKLTDEQKSLIKLGGQENLLAVHVHQNWGGCFADCGLYTKVDGGLDMGYTTPWTGKVLFNSYGGYNYQGNNTPSTIHGWEKLYEAQEGDKYTVHLDKTSQEQWGEQLHFKTPIRLAADHEYSFKCKMTGTGNFTDVTVKLATNDDDEIIPAMDTYAIEEGNETEVSLDLEQMDLQDLKFVFDFAGGDRDSTTVTISDMQLLDNTDGGKDLWTGTSYFNYMYMTVPDTTVTKDDDGNIIDETPYQKQIKDGQLDGRTETLSWTQADFDDSMWAEAAMPVGNSGYMNEVQTIWPGGENTNYWIRRDFELDKVNERLSYALNVCHDDTYETYVNGHLLQKNTGWTNGKSPVQVHIPAKYLNVGKNVIATYIQQNWGGKFYDCGINVEEVNYDECAQQLKDAIATADTTKTLTKRMLSDLKQLVAEGENELATNKDAAEVKEYAKNLKSSIATILGYAGDVATLQQTIAVCQTVKDNGYLGSALTNAVENIDTCATNGQTNTLLSALRVARKRNAMERHTENFIGSQPEADGEYYIYNVGERAFLAGGENWCTHQAVAYASNAMQLININRDGEELQEGYYRIETFRPNGTIGTNDFLGYNGYVDCNVNDSWMFVPVEGKTNVFNIVRAGQTADNHMLGFRNGKTNNYALSYNVVDTDMKDSLDEDNQWMLISVEELAAFIQNGTKENPADATYMITNPGFDQRLSVDNWIIANDGGNVGIYGRGDNHPDFTEEAWNANEYELSYEIYDDALIPGWYELQVQGYYRDGTYEHQDSAYIASGSVERRANMFAGYDDEVLEPLCSIMEGANTNPGLGRLDATGTYRFPDATFGAAEYYFENGYYWNKMPFYISEENAGMIRFGVRKTGYVYGDWVVTDNYRLKYCGNADAPDAINSIDDQENTQPKAGNSVYNLLGQKMTRLQKGVNIVNGKKMIMK